MDLLNDLLSKLGPKVTEQVSSQFGLSQESADKVLPSIAPAIASSLQDKLASGGQSAISELMSGAAGGDGNGSLVSNLFGSQLDSITKNFAGQVGVDSGKAQGILGAVVPLVMSFITNKAGGGAGNLASVLSSLGGLKEMAGPVAGLAAKSGLLGKLSGMFGK